MNKRITFAGFGGQGIIVAGKLLANSAMMEGKEVSHFPSYGAEMLGGTCNCSVVISDELIVSPIFNQADIQLIFNLPSKVKFESQCRPDGLIFINSSLIKENPSRTDLSNFLVDATNIASKLGSLKSANMVMLGALVKITNLVKLESIIDSLPEIISKRNQSLIEVNIKCLHEGYNSVGI